MVTTTYELCSIDVFINGLTSLAIEEINKVSNLIWLCTNCFDANKPNEIPEDISLLKKLKMLTLSCNELREIHR